MKLKHKERKAIVLQGYHISKQATLGMETIRLIKQNKPIFTSVFENRNTVTKSGKGTRIQYVRNA